MRSLRHTSCSSYLNCYHPSPPSHNLLSTLRHLQQHLLQIGDLKHPYPQRSVQSSPAKPRHDKQTRQHLKEFLLLVTQAQTSTKYFGRAELHISNPSSTFSSHFIAAASSEYLSGRTINHLELQSHIDLRRYSESSTFKLNLRSGQVFSKHCCRSTACSLLLLLLLSTPPSIKLYIPCRSWTVITRQVRPSTRTENRYLQPHMCNHHLHDLKCQLLSHV